MSIKKFTEIVFPGTGVAGGIIQSETGAEEFVLLNKEATRAAFSLYIPAQTQTQMYPVQIKKEYKCTHLLLD